MKFHCLDQPLRTQADQEFASQAYVLRCEASSTTLTDGAWSFSIQNQQGDVVLEAHDRELGDLNRLTLLAALRGLESFDGPSAVTLVSKNRYLIRSLSDSLPRWRRNNFVWEHFGRRIEVQNADLWRRVDRTLSIHRVEACLVSSRLISVGTLAERPDDPLPDSPTNRATNRTPCDASKVASIRIDSPHDIPVRRRRRGRRPLHSGPPVGDLIATS